MLTSAACKSGPGTKRKTGQLVFAYTVLFAALMGLWYAIFAINGKCFIWQSDALKQHYAALMYIGRWYRSVARCVLTGAPVPTWDLTIGFGSDVIATLSYYGLGDPLNLLSALVPSRHTETLLSVLIVLRIYLGGLAFLAFSLRHKNSRLGTLAAALAYAFCAWTLQGALKQPVFLSPLYCFPLLLLGADDLFEQKNPWRYIGAVALAALSNFLFFYMMAVLLVLYAVAKYLKNNGFAKPKKLAVLVAQFVVYSAVGGLIAGAVLVPTVCFMLGGKRFALDRIVCGYPYEYYGGLIANLTTGAEFESSYSTLIGIAPLAVLGVLVLFSCRKRDGWLKVAWCTLFLFLLIPWCGKILNGFSYMQNRWVWAFSLLEAFILARIFPRLGQLSGREKTVLAALLGGYCVLAFWQKSARTEWALVGVVGLLLLTVLASATQWDASALWKIALLGTGCVGIAVNIWYAYSTDESGLLNEFLDQDTAWKVTVEANPANVLKLLPDDTLWRYDSEMSDQVNSAMLMGLNGTGYFFSLNNGNVSQLFADVGQNMPVEYSIDGLENRSTLEALFGVKYMLCAPDGVDHLPAIASQKEILATDVAGQNCAVYPNSAALPIGFATNRILDGAEYEKMTPIERQSALLNGVLLAKDAASAGAYQAAERDTDVVVADAQVSYSGIEKVSENCYYAPKDGGQITFSVNQPMSECETYFVVQGMDYVATNPYKAMTEEELAALSPSARLELKKQYAHFWCKQSVYLHLVSNLGEGNINYAMRNSQYYCGRHDFAYSFGCTAEGLSTLTVVLPYAGYYTFDSLQIVCQKVGDIAARTEALAQAKLENVAVETNSIRGTIASDDDKILVLQIPYSDGWSVAVDGKPAELLCADVAFLGVAIGEGNHTVVFSYQTPGLLLGCVFTGAGVLLWIIFAAVHQKRHGNKRKRTATE